MDQKRIECGHCFQIVDVVLQGEQKSIQRLVHDPVSGRDQTVHGFRADVGFEQQERAAIAFCPLCLQPSLLAYKRSPTKDSVIQKAAESGGSARLVTVDILTDFRQFPPPRDRKINPNWPEKVARAWDDTMRSHDAGVSPPSVATSIGSCLQTACRALNAKGKNLVDEIVDLRLTGHITEGMAVWATKIRLLRNAGTHDYEADATEVEEAIEFMRMFLHLTFTLGVEIQAHASDGLA